MPYAYDDDNIFAKILRDEIPNDTVMETEHTLAFRDIRPQAKTHVLVIPKGKYVNHDHFCLEASEAEIVDFNRVAGQVCAALELQPTEGAGGYRVISNAGGDAGQEVPHYHIHILGGGSLGPMLSRL
ncbi:HIT domain-containing protein [Tranquillimonas alkanivorans]|uniref:Histidine triad (HIT) family protein n=1 Tax=Tranquillimonas alkanivorans TaxID=441119 RepID=A0A1I5TA88_9RHOB|nr:HIT domain-containing protein [Tranquillimonas alkanivorans]SFP79973.1 histidine triad (HIT) family protein [Tranquillimonas alkanivorans]